MGDSFTNLLIHMVFSTKNRAKDLTSVVRAELYPYLGGLAREKSAKAYAIGGGLDHVHALLSVPPTIAPADLVSFLKSNSSRWMRGKFNRHFTWQAGYGAFSVSQSKVPAVAAYIEGQEEHHKRVDFEDELVSLLKRNEIRFEAERLWGAPEGQHGSSPARKSRESKPGFRSKPGAGGPGF